MKLFRRRVEDPLAALEERARDGDVAVVPGSRHPCGVDARIARHRPPRRRRCRRHRPRRHRAPAQARQLRDLLAASSRVVGAPGRGARRAQPARVAADHLRRRRRPATPDRRAGHGPLLARCRSQRAVAAGSLAGSDRSGAPVRDLHGGAVAGHGPARPGRAPSALCRAAAPPATVVTWRSPPPSPTRSDGPMPRSAPGCVAAGVSPSR